LILSPLGGCGSKATNAISCLKDFNFITLRGGLNVGTPKPPRRLIEVIWFAYELSTFRCTPIRIIFPVKHPLGLPIAIVLKRSLLLLYPNRAIKEIMDNLSSPSTSEREHDPSSTQRVTSGIESLKEETATIKAWSI
jgi:hypothetical protein